MASNVIHKIAIIEDDQAINQMYRLKFETEGFNVRTASDGDAGLRLCEEFIPDLMLLDLRMPHMNGEEMLTKVREQSWGGNIRVVILTNISKDEAPSILRFLGVDRYVVKAHYTPAQVVQIVREVLHITT
jgi:DNA-binding response OmpR family regulator